MLTALTHLPLLARSELPGKTCRFPTAHPLTPPPVALLLTTESLPPPSQVGTGPSAQGPGGCHLPWEALPGPSKQEEPRGQHLLGKAVNMARRQPR